MMPRSGCHLLLGVLFASFLPGNLLAEPDSAVDAAQLDWIAAHEDQRARKDEMFRTTEESPLIAEHRADFEGLVYYPLDLRFLVPGRLHRYARVRQVSVPDTKGSQMLVERIGQFHFEWDGKPFWLEVMGSTRDNDLSVYFTDRTNGLTTYPAGRYAPVERSVDGSYLIDFNNAYSPYCAYNPAYICPLPPPQNRLSFHVEAGELVSGPDLAH